MGFRGAQGCKTGRCHSLSHKTLARSALSCRGVHHWFARMLLTPTRLSRMAVSMGSSKDISRVLPETELRVTEPALCPAQVAPGAGTGDWAESP